MTTLHCFDEALALQPLDAPGRYAGSTHPAYWNMVGPFGGATAATLLNAVLRHPEVQGTPLSLTVNYAAALEAGSFELQARPVRTNRSTQHWLVELSQGGAVAATATVVTALRRDTWGASDLPAPLVPRPEAVEPVAAGPARLAWLANYEMRPIKGGLPERWDGRGQHSESLLWVREAPERALDFAALAALSDVFLPRIYLRRAQVVPIGTVSLTTYFHADAALLARVGSGYLLGRAVGQQFGQGFFDQAAQLWSEAGELIATSSQIVYYRE
ncbi:MAG: acyl-CoA thioesterase [Roseateles depolymerans]|uniref:Acyl-CoA thioesterase n=1 Tax=Roseateles depolymerans TaxID=76731 RepID=A0A2W5E433_9BURK|nr:MAG: acyl-CoA thioesterase [Roseateles depolymerans]